MARSLDWMDRIACGGIPGFTRLPWPAQLKLCNVCEVRAECLEFGLETSDVWSVRRQGIVYGGVAPHDLHQMLKQRARNVAACQAPARLQVTAQLPHVQARREDLVETVTELLADRQTPEAIAARLGRTTEAIAQALHRAGVDTLAPMFEAAARRKLVVCDTDARRVVAG